MERWFKISAGGGGGVARWRDGDGRETGESQRRERWGKREDEERGRARKENGLGVKEVGS